MRALLWASFTDRAGNVRGARALTFWEDEAGTVPLSTDLFTTRTGSATYGPGDAQTNADGEFTGWSNVLTPIWGKVAGRTTTVPLVFLADNSKRPVCVTDFGVLGNFTDETARIQDAIDYAESINAELYFPPGAYLHTGLVSTKRIAWRGAGKWRSTLYLAGTVSTTTDNVTVVGQVAAGATAIESTGGGFYNLGFLPVSNAGRHGINFDTNATGRQVFRFEMNNVLASCSTTNPDARAVRHTPNPLAAGAGPGDPNGVSAFSQISFINCEFGGGVLLEDATDSVWFERCNISGANIGIEMNTVRGAAKWVIERCTITATGGCIKATAKMTAMSITGTYFEPAGEMTGDKVLIDLAGSTAEDIDAVFIRDNQLSIVVGSGTAIRLRYCKDTHIGPNRYYLVSASSVGIETNATSSGTEIHPNNKMLAGGAGTILSDLGEIGLSFIPTVQRLPSQAALQNGNLYLGGSLRTGRNYLTLGAQITSAGTIAPAANTDGAGGNFFFVTGTATINTITPRVGPNNSSEGDHIYLVSSAGFTLGSAGNIIPANAAAVATNRVVELFYVSVVSKWYEVGNR